MKNEFSIEEISIALIMIIDEIVLPEDWQIRSEIGIIKSDDFIDFHIVDFLVRIEPFIDCLQGS